MASDVLTGFRYVMCVGWLQIVCDVWLHCGVSGVSGCDVLGGFRKIIGGTCWVASDEVRLQICVVASDMFEASDCA